MNLYYDHRDFGNISPNKKETEKTKRHPNLENGERTKGPMGKGKKKNQAWQLFKRLVEYRTAPSSE
jgi:hypothetical protein